MNNLPSAIAHFVQSQQTIPAPEEQGQYPYSDYWWKAVACALLSGRVKPKGTNGLPNLTDVNRLCKEANFNQHYFETFSGFLVACDVVKSEFDSYQRGRRLDDFWSHDLARVRAATRTGLLALIRRHTPFHAWRPTMVFDGCFDFLRSFFAAFEGRALRYEDVGGTFSAFSRLSEKELAAWVKRLHKPEDSLGVSPWHDWLDPPGQQAMMRALFESGWAYTVEDAQQNWVYLGHTGRVMLGFVDPPAPPPVATEFKVLPNLCVLAGVDLPLPTLLPLYRYCKIKRLDRIVEFQLDKKSMQAMPSKTLASEELLQALKACGSLPETVTRFLTDQGPTGGVLRFRYCSGLVKPEDPALLSVIRSHPKLKSYIEPGGPEGYLVIKGQSDPNNFIRRCREHGFEVKPF